MNRIQNKLLELKEKNKKALIPYITPEFPVRGTTVPLMTALEKAGASMIEVGVPFSDPIADGPTIQTSSYTAIQNGVTLDFIFEQIKIVRQQSEIPLLLMGYFNTFYHYGEERFLDTAVKCGVDGMIIPDLLPEESEGFRTICARHGISNVFLIAPTSSDKRIGFVDSVSTDFSYCVSVTGVTGARSSFGNGEALEGFLRRVKRNSHKPFVVGFGVSKPEQVAALSHHADGVVVGSALIQQMASCSTVTDAVEAARNFFRSLKD
ncbi:MAG: tryptophan synthase subunit alpha [Bacteroidota bacterium]|nr:tryptophan synthase subunit alpha [Bacteroidota bacterium]